MGRLFNVDSKFFQFMTRVADLMIVNICCLLCCIPIVTIGPAFTAMYYVTLKMVKNEETYPTKNFFHSFRQNLKQGVIINLIMIAALLLLSFDLYFVYQALQQTETTFYRALGFAFLFILLLYALVLCYVYPILSRFENSVKNTLRNAILMAIRHLPYTVVILILNFGPILVLYYSTVKTLGAILMIYLFIGFALIAYVASFLFDKIFANYMPKEEAAAGNGGEYEIDSTVFKNLQPTNATEDEEETPTGGGANPEGSIEPEGGANPEPDAEPKGGTEEDGHAPVE